jgi:UDPglucose--hexose-1-phosphate uridylyltransferase
VRERDGSVQADLRRDPLTGDEVVIVAKRQARPNLPASGCPFCPGGLEAPEPYDVRWFPNRWPALPHDHCEVVLYTPDHDATFWSLGVEGARKVVDLWAERTKALGAHDDVDYVLVFENRGPEVGATIAHPHGQIYAFAEVPAAPLAELTHDTCQVCAEEPGDRLVTQNDWWRAWVPHAATWPFAMVLATRAHAPDLPSLRDASRDGLAAILVEVLARLDALFDEEMPYMLWVHQRPTTGVEWPAAHVHLHIAPLYRSPGTQRFVAAGELGSGLFFNPVDPSDAADALRAAAVKVPRSAP